jgi:hypothetical protein
LLTEFFPPIESARQESNRAHGSLERGKLAEMSGKLLAAETVRARHASTIMRLRQCLIRMGTGEIKTLRVIMPAINIRPLKFTPERIEQIKTLVERGLSREQIAEMVGVTLGPLQVTCSRLDLRIFS